METLTEPKLLVGAAARGPGGSPTGVPVPPTPTSCLGGGPGWRPRTARRPGPACLAQQLLPLGPRRLVAAVTSAGGGHSAAERLAGLAGRLTDRDRTLCRLLYEHRVLTTLQLVDLAFPSRNAAEHRLAILHQLRVVDRFRPHHTPGSAPYHYVLGPLGAALLAAQADQDPGQLGYRRDRTLALAHSQRLAHLVGVNSFFSALARAAHQHPDAALERWWSEQRCAAHWGRLVHPDGYGRWREHHTRVEFFLEYDRDTEAPQRLAAKLPGYLQLAQASGIATPLLLWVPAPAREAATRQALSGSSLPVATATPHPDHTPAGPLWLPLQASGPRRRLAQLASAW